MTISQQPDDTEANKAAARKAITDYLEDREQTWRAVAEAMQNTEEANQWNSTWADADNRLQAWKTSGTIDDRTAEMVATKAEDKLGETVPQPDFEPTVQAAHDRMRSQLKEALQVWRGLTALEYRITQEGR